MPLTRRGSSIRFIARPTYGVVLVSATGHLRSGAVDAGHHRLPGCFRDGVDDVRVTGAAAQVAAQSVGDLLAVRLAVVREQRNRRHDHAGRAETALETVTLPEALLHRMEVPVGDAFDRRHLGAV